MEGGLFNKKKTKELGKVLPGRVAGIIFLGRWHRNKVAGIVKLAWSFA